MSLLLPIIAFALHRSGSARGGADEHGARRRRPSRRSSTSPRLMARGQVCGPAARGASTGRGRSALLMCTHGQVARPAGLEPATPSLEGSCSIRLSYGRRPIGRKCDPFLPRGGAYTRPRDTAQLPNVIEGTSATRTHALAQGRPTMSLTEIAAYERPLTRSCGCSRATFEDREPAFDAGDICSLFRIMPSMWIFRSWFSGVGEATTEFHALALAVGAEAGAGDGGDVPGFTSSRTGPASSARSSPVPVMLGMVVEGAGRNRRRMTPSTPL